MGEKQGVRDSIDKMATTLVREGGMDPNRAKKLATDTALRVSHGEKHRTNFTSRRDRGE